MVSLLWCGGVSVVVESGGCVVVVPVGVPLALVAVVFVDVFFGVVVGVGGLWVGLYDELVFVGDAVVCVEWSVGDGWCGYLVAFVGD